MALAFSFRRCSLRRSNSRDNLLLSRSAGRTSVVRPSQRRAAQLALPADVARYFTLFRVRYHFASLATPLKREAVWRHGDRYVRDGKRRPAHTRDIDFLAEVFLTSMRELMQNVHSTESSIELSVLKANPRARNFYARLGFVEIAQSANHIRMRWPQPPN